MTYKHAKSKSPHHCDYCGLSFTGSGYSPDENTRFCCYGCYLVQGIVGARNEEGIASWILVRLGIGAFFAMNVMMISLLLYAESEASLGTSVVNALHCALVILSAPALIILGLPLAVSAFRGLRTHQLNMDALIITSSLIAFTISTRNVIENRGHIYFDTATMLLLIVTLGRLLEASVKSRTSSAVKELMDLAPQTATVLRNGQETIVPVQHIVEGDLLRVRPGERIATDSAIIEGECFVEEAAFTGESRPRHCAPGDNVFGGSVNCDGFITLRATAVGEDSMLAQVQRMIRDAQDNRAPVERIAERAASFLIPAIWVIAMCAGLYWWLGRGDPERAAMSALAVLVVACPCSIGLATPIATCLAIGVAAGKGVLIRSGEILERLPGLKKLFFDKTGTLTCSQLALKEVLTASDALQEDEALSWAASVEAGSEHAIARAITSAAVERNISLGNLQDFKVVPGHGVLGRIQLNGLEKIVTVGNWQLVSSEHSPNHDLEPSPDEMNTTVYAGWDGQIQAVFVIHDSIRPDARPVVQTLQSRGVAVTLLSGDQAGPVGRTADAVGIEDFISCCTIQDKVNAIRSSRTALGGGVGMVGDGINDAPALAEADVGFAVHGGTDLAKQAGGVVLLGDDLMRIPWVLDLSQKTYRIIRQNLCWAFGYNFIAVILAFLGFVHPLIAASAMFLSSLAVLSNSLRLTKTNVSSDPGNTPEYYSVYSDNGYNRQT